MPAPRPDSEPERVAAVRRSGLRSAAPEAALDELVGLAARLCGTTSAEINLVDADDVWVCATRGLLAPGDSVDRDQTFCTWTVLDPDRPTVVPDAADDPRFAANPFVTAGIIRSYAAWPLLAEGQAIGTLCVHDPGPGTITDEQVETLAVLARAAQAHLALRRDVEALSEQARTDALTGAANRRALDEVLLREVARARRHGGSLSVLMLDLDHFKAFNDTHGHQAGDLLLQAAAGAWRARLRPADLLGRFGGEEFCVLLPDCPIDGAVEVAERLREGVPGEQTCSIGAAEWHAADSGTAIIARADAALYDAKRAGRDRVVAVAVPAGTAGGGSTN